MKELYEGGTDASMKAGTFEVLGEVEHLAEGDRFRGMVRVGGHDVPHVSPPFLALGRLGDGLPAGVRGEAHWIKEAESYEKKVLAKWG
jgi:hypothetical protein